MTIKMDRQYLEEHHQAVHTRESFGAAITDIIMKMAIEKVGDGSADVIEFDLPVRIEPRTVRRRLSSAERALMGDDPVFLPDGDPPAIAIGPIVVDCLTFGVGVPPLTASFHMPV
ncbi:hypothetical protein ACIHFD_61860 [Nonomuraea sp. NPDC051941]|uniref:hypothetical protein n=1 Tax=Nonomuraea sp. NPDC051941 TaxID=3364373 RepID=UPI0037C5ADC0